MQSLGDLDGTIVFELSDVFGPVWSPHGNLMFSIAPTVGPQELWMAPPVRGATQSFMLRSDEIFWLQTSGERIFVSFQKFQGDIWVMDLEWED